MSTYKILMLLCSVAFFSSCVKDVDIDTAREQKVVVNAILTPGSTQYLKLTLSNPLSDYFYDEVVDAEVVLKENDSEVGSYKKVGFSKWELEFTPQINRNYKLEVRLPDDKLISATTSMPQPAVIEKVSDINTDNRKHFVQQLTELTYYAFIIDQTGTEITADPVVEYNNKLEMHIGTNHPNVDHFNIEESLQSIWGNEFSTMGYMAYLRIDNAKNRNDKEAFYIEGRLGKSMVFFRTASEEYDKYLKTSLQKMRVYEAFDDDTQKFDENSVYSNINNGLGIFAAYYDKTFVFNEVEN